MAHKSNRTGSRQVLGAMMSVLPEGQQILARSEFPGMRMSAAHCMLLEALAMVCGRNRRETIEGMIEELARRNGLPSPPVPTSMLRQSRDLGLRGLDLRWADRIARDWPELWEHVRPAMEARAAAAAALAGGNARELRRSERRKRLLDKQIAQEISGEEAEDDGWQPEADECQD